MIDNFFTKDSLEMTRNFIDFKTLDTRQLTFHEPKWIVDGMLQTGILRPSLLAAKPEAGKSTVARTLIAAVSMGEPFLGRKTTPAGVLYWQTEDTSEEVFLKIKRMGWDSARHENVHILDGDPYDSDMDNIAELLNEDPSIRLVIIETLDELLRMDDIKENTAARKAFATFTKHLAAPFHHRAAFLILHQFKKNETDFAGDALLGATVIRARTDQKIYLKQLSEDDEQRIIWSTVRDVGTKLPKTMLKMNPITRKVTLGHTYAVAQRKANEKEREQQRQRLVQIIMAHPRIAHGELLGLMGGNTQEVGALIRDEVAFGFIQREGTGRSRNPYRYSIGAVPVDNGIPAQEVNIAHEQVVEEALI